MAKLTKKSARTGVLVIVGLGLLTFGLSNAGISQALIAQNRPGEVQNTICSGLRRFVMPRCWRNPRPNPSPITTLPVQNPPSQPGQCSGWRKFFPKCWSGGGTDTTTPPAGQVSVPSEFQQLYTKLDGKLDELNKKVDSNWDGSRYNTQISADLLAANSNIGESILAAGHYETTIKYLDRLQELGVNAVSLADVNFPIMDPNFQSKEKADQYLAYYKKVANEIKKRGLKLTVEVQTILPTFSSLPVSNYYKSMDFETYKQRRADMLVLIAKELNPDYLSLGGEPDTEQSSTGQPVNNVTNATSMINFFLDELNESGVSGIQYGAGFGTWLPDWKAWTDSYVKKTDLDFLNIHAYVIDGDFFERVWQAADIAHQNGKKVAIEETWMNKWQLGDPSGMTATAEVSSRNAYSFWAPLDQKYLELLLKTAHYKQMEFVTPFWTSYFFNYLEYESAKKLSATQRFGDAFSEGIKAAGAGKLTVTGQKFKELNAKY